MDTVMVMDTDMVMDMDTVIMMRKRRRNYPNGAEQKLRFGWDENRLADLIISGC
jgi:hypothetical protein